MGFGGPVWHASVAPLGGLIPKRELARMARRVLADVGDLRAGEWEEWTGRALHLRRRLSTIEAEHVGPVIDIRGTDEARQRVAQVADRLKYAPDEIVLTELGVTT